MLLTKVSCVLIIPDTPGNVTFDFPESRHGGNYPRFRRKFRIRYPSENSEKEWLESTIAEEEGHIVGEAG